MQGFKHAVLAVVLVGALHAAWATAAQAQVRIGACPQGAKGTVCKLWTGKVTFIGDGDTLSVDIKGDGTTKPARVRMTGINAMEESYYTNVPEDRFGECHANEATARLEGIVKAAKGRVQLAAQDEKSHSGARLRRAVSVKIGGKYRDVGRILVGEGHTLFLSNATEWAWNRTYAKLAQRAAWWKVALWNPEYCAAGPAANVRIWA